MRLAVGLGYYIATLPLKALIVLCYFAAGLSLLGLVCDVVIHLLVLLAPAGSPARQSFFEGVSLLFKIAGLFIVCIGAAVLLSHLQTALKRAAAALQG